MSKSLSKMDGPANNTRAKASRNVRQLSMMESSTENRNENEGQMVHATGAEMVVADKFSPAEVG